jgi:hypothetical protein
MYLNIWSEFHFIHDRLAADRKQEIEILVLDLSKFDFVSLNDVEHLGHKSNLKLRDI